MKSSNFQEIADRRSRPQHSDRSLLSERTVGSLRLLARTSKPYSASRSRSHVRRSAQHLPDYLAASGPEASATVFGFREAPDSDEMMDDEEDVAQNFVDPSSWDVNPGRNSLNAPARSPSPIHSEWYHPLRLPGPSGSLPSPRWSSTLGPASMLSRQASIRRAARRGVDFNESSRTRHTGRDSPSSSTSPRAEALESVTEPRDGLVLTRPLVASQVSGRRFFPLSRARRHNTGTARPLDWSDIPPWSAAAVDEAGNTSGDGDGEETSPVFDQGPRLRRGGVLPPESLLAESSRQGSPGYSVPNAEGAEFTTEQVIAALDGRLGNSRDPTPFIPPPYETPRGDEMTRPLDTAVSDEPAAYPTPGGSTEGENVA